MSAAGDAWVTALGDDARRSGFDADALPIQHSWEYFPDPDPTITKGPVPAGDPPPLVYDNGRVFTTTVSGDGIALDVATGEVVWRTDLGSSAISAPAMARDALFMSVDLGIVYSLQASDGEIIWESDVGSYVRAGLVTDGERLIAARRDGVVVCLDARDGSELWQQKVEERIIQTPSIHGQTVIVPQIDGRFHALSLLDGHQMWEIDVEEENAAGPAIIGGALAVITETALKLFDVETGESLWTYDIDWGVPMPLVVESPFAYVVGFTSVEKINAEAKRSEWKVDLPGEAADSPALFGDTLYVPGFQDYIAMIDVRTGGLTDVPLPATVSSIIADGEWLVYHGLDYPTFRHVIRATRVNDEADSTSVPIPAANWTTIVNIVLIVAYGLKCGRAGDSRHDVNETPEFAPR